MSKSARSIKDSPDDEYTIEQHGQMYTRDYSCYIKNSLTNQYVSPLHDIPLFCHHKQLENVLNAIIEIPRWSNAKMELSMDLKLNPIIQDTKDGELRFINNLFPMHGFNWNYGSLPQTWDNPDELDETSGYKGDNDPLDICEIGSSVLATGQVIQVKILGKNILFLKIKSLRANVAYMAGMVKFDM